jgi:hypothetical protein
LEVITEKMNRISRILYRSPCGNEMLNHEGASK